MNMEKIRSVGTPSQHVAHCEDGEKGIVCRKSRRNFTDPHASCVPRNNDRGIRGKLPPIEHPEMRAAAYGLLS